MPINNTYTYEAFGNIISETGSKSVNAYKFSTKETDPTTGLVYFGARYYNPLVGRWLTKDPLGMVDGVNMYIYCQNSPMVYIDPRGLSGYLTIHSLAGDDAYWSFSYGAHSWIEYTPDGGNTLMYGTWGNCDGGPMGFRKNTVAEFELTKTGAGVSRTVYINDAQEKEMNNLITKYELKGTKAWSLRSACSSFASNVWYAATGEKLQNRHLLGLGYSDPNILVESIQTKNNIDKIKSQTKCCSSI